jgi:8-oxo-dGTP pyrophosphatase MutT (NUDIX family)
MNDFSTSIASHLDVLALRIAQTTSSSTHNLAIKSYDESLKYISLIVQKLFDEISAIAASQTTSEVRTLRASPKGLCENFAFLETNAEGAITHVILAQNKDKGFLQLGGGKTNEDESSRDAAFREAVEEFNYSGSIAYMTRVGVETRSGLPVFHFAKGVHVAVVDANVAAQLKLGDDMASNIITRMPVDEYLAVVDANTKPIDHAFDMKLIAATIRSYRADGVFAENRRMTITSEDRAVAEKAKAWMKTVSVDLSLLAEFREYIGETAALISENRIPIIGEWKSKENRGVVQKAAQKVVDAIVERLLPAWTYAGKNGEEKACQLKVQDAVSVTVEGKLLPSFLTLPQMVAMSMDKDQFEVLGIIDLGVKRDILWR